MPCLLAEFPSADALVAAYRAMYAEGYRRLETYTPFAVPELLEHVPTTLLPQLMFGGGAGGCASAALLQWYCNAYDYPLNVGGRPLSSIPAWVPIMFELTVLGAALTGFVLMIVGSGMPRLHHPIDRAETRTLDRFLLTVDLADPRFTDGCRTLLEGHGARLEEIA